MASVEEFFKDLCSPTPADAWPSIRTRQAEFLEIYGDSFKNAAAMSNAVWCGASPLGGLIGFRFWREVDHSVVDVTLPIEIALLLMKNMGIAAVICGERYATANQTGGNA